MRLLRSLVIYFAVLAAGALFGFFFTMSVSIMPGLDATDPYAAMIANQDIGRATQRSAFFVALLGTPLALIAALTLMWRATTTRNWLLVAIISYVAMMVVTLLFNVPLNQLLDGMTITPDVPGLADQWAAYSLPWQKWNWVRVAASGMTLFCSAVALRSIAQTPDES